MKVNNKHEVDSSNGSNTINGHNNNSGGNRKKHKQAK